MPTEDQQPDAIRLNRWLEKKTATKVQTDNVIDSDKANAMHAQFQSGYRDGEQAFNDAFAHVPEHEQESAIIGLTMKPVNPNGPSTAEYFGFEYGWETGRTKMAQEKGVPVMQQDAPVICRFDT